MVCIYCSSKTKVTNSRTSKKRHSTWRRRECLQCSSIVTSYEHIDYSSALRVQKNTLRSFSRDALFMSVFSSLQHRTDALDAASALTETIMHKLLTVHKTGVLRPQDIISSTTQVLRNFDTVAGSVYAAKYTN